MTQVVQGSLEVRGSPIGGLTLAQTNSVQRLRGFLQRLADESGSGSAKLCKTVLSNVLRFAVESGALPTSAMRDVRLPKSQVERQSTNDHRRALTPSEQQTVLALARAQATDPVGNPRTVRKREALSDLVHFMLGTGVRISEARTVRWEHIDLSEGVVRLHGTKSAAARRRIDLPDWVTEQLRVRVFRLQEHFTESTRWAKHTDDLTRQEVVNQIDSERDRVGVSGYVFGAPARFTLDAAWDQSNANAAVRNLLRDAGVPWAVPHTFRRTVITRLAEAGAPYRQIADLVGHADAHMTMSTYLGHDFEGDKRSLAAML